MADAGYVHPHMAACLMAVGRGATSVTEVMREVNLSRSVVWRWLDLLRTEGLIIWPHDTEGALRPNFGVVQTRREP